MQDILALVCQEHPLEAPINQVILAINQNLPCLVFLVVRSQLVLSLVLLLLLEALDPVTPKQELVVHQVEVVFLNFILILVANTWEELDKVLFEA